MKNDAIHGTVCGKKHAIVVFLRYNHVIGRGFGLGSSTSVDWFKRFKYRDLIGRLTLIVLGPSLIG